MMRALALSILGSCTLLTACAPRQVLYPALGMEPPALNELPADFERPISHETGQPMPGFGGGGKGIQRTPVLFVHGNTVSARFWNPTRERFAERGYNPDELWGFSHGWNNVRYFDANDLSVPSIQNAVTALQQYWEAQGESVPQIDVIGHSLGVTILRQWMQQTNSWHLVRNFIGACGANDGVWTAWPDTRGQQRPVSWELHPGSPWLEQLNRQGEIPGPTRYMTIYDGTGRGDVLFPPPFEDSSALEGAYNLAYNREHGSLYGHLNLPWEEGPIDAMVDWLRASPDAPADAERPDVAIKGNRLSTSVEGALLHCRTDGPYPSLATPGQQSLSMQEGLLYTCFARHPDSGLAGPMHRFTAWTEADLERPRPSLTATPSGGSFEHPQRVELHSDDPDAFIVYSTAGVTPTTGSPLYTEPVYVAAPLRLTAMAVSPGGISSEPLVLDFDISLELVEAKHTLERQFDSSRPVHYAAERKKGN